MATTIEAPEVVAERVWVTAGPHRDGKMLTAGIVARDEQIAAWCVEHAETARREACRASSVERSAICDGQAAAWHALARLLQPAQPQ